jgi:hypothetical protein
MKVPDSIREHLAPVLSTKPSPLGALTDTDRLLGIPEGLGGIETGKEPGTLQLVASSTVEAGTASWVEAGDSHISIRWTPGKVAAQEISYRERMGDIMWEGVIEDVCEDLCQSAPA